VGQEADFDYSGNMVVNLTKKDFRDGLEGNAISDIEFHETLNKEIKFERGYVDAAFGC
jgi:hypothetical protein